MSSFAHAVMVGWFSVAAAAVAAQAPNADVDQSLATIYADGAGNGVVSNGATYFAAYETSEPLWTARFGVMQLQRARQDPKTIIGPNAGGPGVFSSASDFGYSGAVGPDLSVMRQLANGDRIEARYFGALTSESSVAYGVVSNVIVGSLSFFGPADLTARDFSTLNNAELNWLRPATERFTFIAGARAIGVHDVLNYRFTLPAEFVENTWNTDNYLYGGQLGGDFALWDLDSVLTVNAAVKGGVLYNAADNNLRIKSNLNPVPFEVGDSRGQCALVGDIQITARCQLTNFLAIRAGYQLLWIDGVALATDQGAAAFINGTPFGVDNGGALFYHGLTGGIEGTW